MCSSLLALALCSSTEGLKLFPLFGPRCPQGDLVRDSKGVCVADATSAVVDERCCAFEEACDGHMHSLTEWYSQQMITIKDKCSVDAREIRALFAGDLTGVHAVACEEPCRSVIRMHRSLPLAMTNHGAYRWFVDNCRENRKDAQWMEQLEDDVEIVQRFWEVVRSADCSHS